MRMKRMGHLLLCRHKFTCNSLKLQLGEELNSIKDAGTWKAERVIISKQGTEIKLNNEKDIFLNFCANNYLGLSSNPDIIEVGKQAILSYGAGLSSVRFICGTQDIHKLLEKKIAQFHEREDAIIYPSCFDANAGFFECLLNEEDSVISDELNHASIIDGIRLCKAKRFRYKHRNMNHLEEILQDSEVKKSRRIIIASDGVFSMDGSVAPLPEMFDLAQQYGALIFIDDCHATGFFGKTGRGTEEYFSMNGSIAFINSTFGKALGGASGGYTVSSKEVVDLLRQKSRPYLYSNSLPPSVVSCASKAFDILLSSSDLPQKVADNTRYFREKMMAAGFNISGDNHPICPVMLGDAKLASTFADKIYPVVPKGKARIRVQISASHTFQNIDKCVQAFIAVREELKHFKV